MFLATVDAIQQDSCIQVSNTANRIAPHLAWKSPLDKNKSKFLEGLEDICW